MEIKLHVINEPSEFRAAPLRDRASVSTKAAFTTHYAAVSGEQEVAFVALDLPDHKEYFCVYELLVDPSYRCRGYGAAVIRKCREFATQEGFEKICHETMAYRSRRLRRKTQGLVHQAWLCSKHRTKRSYGNSFFCLT